jgi:2-dehydro-3-deoxyglucarate aldolase/4-hydroxy-2-oxoheptanedioate aldolase
VALTRSSIQAGRTFVGVYVQEFATPGIGRLAAGAGAEWILFDLEHTGWTLDHLRAPIAACTAGDVPVGVKLPQRGGAFAQAALDAGAQFLLAPMVETADDVAAHVAACRFPPEGTRGVMFGLPFDGYMSIDLDVAVGQAADRTIVGVIVETTSAVEHIHEIVAVEGLDLVWLGVNDLCARLGLSDPNDPAVTGAVDHVIATCQRAGIAIGGLATTASDAVDLVDRGARLLVVDVDVRLMRRAWADGIDAVRDAISTNQRVEPRPTIEEERRVVEG